MGLDLLCVGETLVDFLPAEGRGKAVHEVEQWVRCSGGSPANVAVGVARLGGKSAMLGVVGQDEFGRFLRESLAAEGVDVSHLRQTNEGKTGLVFISLSETGERSFAFYRTRAAELLLGERDVDEAFLAQARAVHFGTNSLLYLEAQRASLRMVKAANASGRIVSCDPNLRLHMWADPNELRRLIREIFPSSTVAKLAEDEIEFVTGEKKPQLALEAMRKLGVALPIVTLGEKGATFLWQGQQVSVPAPAVSCVDSTGAGDGFMSGLLFGLTRLFPDAAAMQQASVGEIRELVAFGCAVGSRAVQKIGAVTGLPRLEEVEPSLPAILRAGPAPGRGPA